MRKNRKSAMKLMCVIKANKKHLYRRPVKGFSEGAKRVHLIIYIIIMYRQTSSSYHHHHQHQHHHIILRKISFPSTATIPPTIYINYLTFQVSNILIYTSDETI